MSFETAFTHTVGVEGKYSSNPADSGGETIWGITEALARAYGYTGGMRDMPLATAQTIYYRHVWAGLGLDLVDQASQKIAAEMFDTAVNCGRSVPVGYLQRALNLFNRQQVDYADVPVDGSCGTRTIAALRAFLAKRGARGEAVMLKALNCLQGARYFEIAERRPKDETFTFGWFDNRVAI